MKSLVVSFVLGLSLVSYASPNHKNNHRSIVQANVQVSLDKGLKLEKPKKKKQKRARFLYQLRKLYDQEKLST